MTSGRAFFSERTLDVFLDFETRSILDVGSVGAWKYAAHESTYPLMLAWVSGKNDSVEQWLEWRDGHECPRQLKTFAQTEGVRFHAHNANFEIAIWRRVCVERWGWPDVPTYRWRDTAAKAAHANQPRSLGKACNRVGTRERKDARGKELIVRLSMPQKAVKATKYAKDTADGQHKRGDVRTDSVTYLADNGIETFDFGFPSKAKSAVNGVIMAPAFWNNDPKLLEEFARYNRQDVIAELELDEALPDLTEYEQRVWELDSKINERGIPIDVKLCEAVQRVYAVEIDVCNAAIVEETRDSVDDGPKAVIERHTQGKRLKNWINKRVNFGETLAKEVVEAWLQNPWGVGDPAEEDRVRRVLELCQVAGGSGVKKYWAATAYAEADGRARGQLLYHGAATGRWTGKGIQPTNMVREKIPEEVFFDIIRSGDHEAVRCVAELFGYTVNGLLRQCVRGMIQAPEGTQLIISDFAGIEMRVLQWLARNFDICERFKDPSYDAYVHTASRIFGVPYAEMMDGGSCRPQYKDKRQVGKIADLALQYGMGAEKYQTTCANFGVTVDLEFAQEVVNKWRAANPLIAGRRSRDGHGRDGLWARVDRAAKHVIKHRRSTTATIDKLLRFEWDRRGYLTIELPSGRKLYYYKAKIDKETGQIVYLDGGKSDAAPTSTYGAKLVENITQAVSRDLLVNSMFCADSAGLTIVSHVYDELVVLEDLHDRESCGKLEAAMHALPSWADGLPLAAETFTSKRYTKG